MIGRPLAALRPALLCAVFLTCFGAGPALAQDAPRVYELVTPPGDDPYGMVFSGTDPDGEHAYFKLPEASGVAGSLPDGAVNDLFASGRTTAGWSTSWISPLCVNGRTVFGPDATCLNDNPEEKELNILDFVMGNGGRAVFTNATRTGGNDIGTGSDLFRGDPDGVTLLSADSAGTTGEAISVSNFLASEDLSTVAFTSLAPLLPADTDATADLYANVDGSLRLVTDAPVGGAVQDVGHSATPPLSGQPITGWGVSPDGDHVFFRSTQPLLLADADATSDVYVYDVAAGELRLLSGTGSALSTTFQWASRDSARAFIRTEAALDPVADTDALLDIYAVDAVTGVPTLVSVGTTASAPAFLLGSDDGSHAWFTTSDAIAEAPDDGQRKIYEWTEGGGVVYVATVPGSSTLDLASASLRARPARASSDGSVLVFETPTQLLPEDTNSVADVYQWSGGELTLLTPRPPGEGTAAATLGFRVPAGNSGYFGRAITNDGTSAFITTSNSLVPEDTDGGFMDVYEARADGVSLVSPPGSAPEDALYRDSSEDGEDVFFMTAAPLLGWDQDGVWIDIYNARRGGGFPEPPPPPAGECEGDACQGQPGSPPILQDPVAGGGAGDLTPRRRSRFAISSLSTRQRLRLARGRTVGLTVRVNKPARVTLVAGAKVRGRSVWRARLVTRATEPGRVRIPVRLSNAARDQLQRRGRLMLTFTVRVAGSVTAKSFKSTVRAPRVRR